MLSNYSAGDGDLVFSRWARVQLRDCGPLPGRTSGSSSYGRVETQGIWGETTYVCANARCSNIPGVFRELGARRVVCRPSCTDGSDEAGVGTASVDGCKHWQDVLGVRLGGVGEEAGAREPTGAPSGDGAEAAGQVGASGMDMRLPHGAPQVFLPCPAPEDVRTYVASGTVQASQPMGPWDRRERRGGPGCSSVVHVNSVLGNPERIRQRSGRKKQGQMEEVARP
ncbi:hypothetical protein C2E23DRAFT_584320 [Lenzites betulinus]|nr:hypothetical protein C2E23DRAFT_584320 [Lenzites betulinus]